MITGHCTSTINQPYCDAEAELIFQEEDILHKEIVISNIRQTRNLPREHSLPIEVKKIEIAPVSAPIIKESNAQTISFEKQYTAGAPPKNHRNQTINYVKKSETPILPKPIPSIDIPLAATKQSLQSRAVELPKQYIKLPEKHKNIDLSIFLGKR